MYKKAVRHNKKLSKIVSRSGSLGFYIQNRGFSSILYHKDSPFSVLGFWDIEVGIPSASALILKEANITKGTGTAGTEWVADIGMDAVVKVANVKLETSYASEIKSVAKQIIGTCQCLGIKVEGKTPKEITVEVNDGKWDEKLVN